MCRAEESGPVDLLQNLRRSLAEFTDRVSQVRPDQWDAPTPCADWNVRMLVNHVVSEDRWVPPLFAGATIAEVGHRFSGDVLGADPAGSARDAAEQADLAVRDHGALDRIVHLSSGDTPAQEYIHQLLADHVMHGWDLAVALGAEPRLDADAVHEAAVWFTGAEAAYRSAGSIGPRALVPDDANEQDRLIAAYGRDPGWRPGR
jgi:uncharacterized protein (TIGR03086 family)